MQFNWDKNKNLSNTIKSSNKTDLERLRNMDDTEIDYSDIPELDPPLWEEATIKYPLNKVVIKMRVDEDLAHWLKQMGNESESAMKSLLRSYYIGLKRLQSQIGHNS
jgi:uncharacterized protein (DUF4415 family)